MMPVTHRPAARHATVDLATAAAALGLGRTKAYELARRGQFPCRVIRSGRVYRIPTPGLLELLGVAAEEPRSPTPRHPPLTPPCQLTSRASDKQEDPRCHCPTASRARPRPAETHLPAWVPRQGRQRGEVVIWGAHGGAGTSTLAVWLQPAWDMGAMRPEPDPPYPAKVGHGRALIIACRATAWSAGQATKAVAAVNRQGGQVAVLAVVSDGWPEPRRRPAGSACWSPRPGR